MTTPLQDKIAEAHGIKCVNTLTGFKWIGGKLTKYEKRLVEAVGSDCADKPYAERAKLMQQYSTFFVFGGEESYGYLGTDSVRDKDANAAVIMFAEMLAYLKSAGKTLDEYLDEIYLKCGYYLEDLKSIYREGAAGAAEIQAFLKMLDENPLDEVAGIKVAKSVNFDKDEIFDADGEKIPREKFFFYTPCEEAERNRKSNSTRSQPKKPRRTRNLKRLKIRREKPSTKFSTTSPRNLKPAQNKICKKIKCCPKRGRHFFCRLDFHNL